MFPVDVYEAPTLFPDPVDPPSRTEPFPAASASASGPQALSAPIDAPVLDALVDALMAGADPHARAEVVSAVVGELCASVAWLQGPGPPTGETASLHRVLVAAHDHRDRMQLSGVHATAEWTAAR